MPSVFAEYIPSRNIFKKVKNCHGKSNIYFIFLIFAVTKVRLPFINKHYLILKNKRKMYLSNKLSFKKIRHINIFKTYLNLLKR